MHLGYFSRIVIETYQQFGGLLLSLLQKDAEFIMSVFFVTLDIVWESLLFMWLLWSENIGKRK